jgi:hypothetical protein
MSSNGQNSNNNHVGVIPAGDPSQVIPAGTVGINPQSTLNPNGKFSLFFIYLHSLLIVYLVQHTKGDLDNHANQLNPNNPRYAGHQERLAAAAANTEATVLHQQAQAAYQYANEVETGSFTFYFYYEDF